MEYDFIVTVIAGVLLISRFNLKSKLTELQKKYAALQAENTELIAKVSTPVEQINEAKKEFESIVASQ